ncbi:MAG: serine/threonine-protein kinase, partial [Acidobacteria bacterium]|nr:serine/threonine-protein kinase [Acidobacteriota bacterium]
DRLVALKFLAPRLQQDADSRKRFEREAKAAAGLHHPNICTVFEIGDFEGQIFIAMAFIDGLPLDEAIEWLPLKLADALEVARQAAEGLSEAHRHGVVHRDIKPGNLMLSPLPDGRTRVTLMDFGLAQLAKVSRLTASTTAIGTVSYMSPEQTYGGAVDHRSDLWSLGVVLYEMIGGTAPFKGHYEKAVMYAITEEQHEPLTAVRSGLPIELDWIVDKALAKDPAERYQSAAELLVDLQTLQRKVLSGTTHLSRSRRSGTQPLPDDPTVAAPRLKRSTKARGLAGWALAAALGLALGYSLLHPRAAPHAPIYQADQFSFDEGLSFQPALSPEGSMVAYASDRSGHGNLDIWLQHFGGGEPIALTHDAADDWQPTFSPDGSRIVFRSERDKAGLYVAPVLGGEAQLLAPDGRNPSFSPDGRSIVYWVGEGASSFTGAMYVLSLDAGAPQRIREDFRIAREPVWLADGEHIVFTGQNAEGTQGWWVTGVDDSAEAVRVQALDHVAETHLSEAPHPRSRWGDKILFSATIGGASKLWTLAFGPDGTPGEVAPLTSGAGYEEDPSAADDGVIAFSLLEKNVDVWELPLAADGTAAGEPRPVTTLGSIDLAASVTQDGRLMAYESSRTGNGDVWLRDLRTGQERAVAASEEKEGLPRLSADGRRIAFRRTLGAKPNVMAADVDGSPPRYVCRGCSGPYDWSPDSTAVLARPSNEPSRVMLFPADGSAPRVVLEAPASVIYEARFSPDGRWVAFHFLNSDTTRQIYVAPYYEDRATQASEWIPVTNGEMLDRNIEWAASGDLLYFLSERDGSQCVWGQRLDPVTKQPAGEPFELQHLSSPNRSIVRGGFSLSATKDRLYYSLGATRGNVWMLRALPPDGH